MKVTTALATMKLATATSALAAKMTTESFRFKDENDYEYEIFSIVSSARA